MCFPFIEVFITYICIKKNLFLSFYLIYNIFLDMLIFISLKVMTKQQKVLFNFWYGNFNENFIILFFLTFWDRYMTSIVIFI